MNEVGHYSSCVLQSLAWLSSRKATRYCFPSQEALVEILTRVYGVSRCRRTLNYHLEYLEDKGFIKRIRRISKCLDGRPAFASTIYSLKKRGLAFLGKILQRISQAGVMAWSKFKELTGEITPRIDRVQSLLSSIGRPVSPG